MTLSTRFSLLSALAFGCLLSLPAFAQQTATGVGPNYETRLSSIEEQMRALNGRVEQVEFAIKRVDQAVQRMQGDVDGRLTKLEAEEAEEEAATAQAQQAAAAQPVPTGATPAQPATIPPPGATDTKSAAPPPDFGLTPQEQYDRAFDTLRKADYPAAEVAFKAFIEKNPKDKLLENAKYWYGESLYVQNKYGDAAAAFADAYQQNPQGSKAPDSLLKLGLALGGLSKTAEACTALGQVKVKYPKASTTVLARADEARLKLKCGAR